MFRTQQARQIVNVGLRGVSLAAKLLLTLYMGRYLTLSELGLYGLVFSAVSIAAAVLGGKLDFVVARDLVGASDREALLQMRDQAVFYGFHYLLFAALAACLAFAGALSPLLLLAVFVLSLLESLANMSSVNLISLGHPTLSNVLFFVRAGSWCLAVAALGFFAPQTRTLEAVLLAWTAGVSLSLLLTLYVWRRLPWAQMKNAAIDWARLRRGVRQCFPIWIGAICGVGALHVERFVVSYYLDLEKVGIVTFYASFALALLALVQSGFFALSFPHLISHHKNGQKALFWRDARQTGWHVALFLALAALATGFAVPHLGALLGKTQIAAETTLLWLMLAAVWIRGNADSLYYILYARHQDWENWTGYLLFLIPSLGGNLLLIPAYGLNGVGLSSILAALFLLGWRGYFVWRPRQKNIL